MLKLLRFYLYTATFLSTIYHYIIACNMKITVILVKKQRPIAGQPQREPIIARTESRIPTPSRRGLRNIPSGPRNTGSRPISRDNFPRPRCWLRCRPNNIWPRRYGLS